MFTTQAQLTEAAQNETNDLESRRKILNEISEDSRVDKKAQAGRKTVAELRALHEPSIHDAIGRGQFCRGRGS